MKSYENSKIPRLFQLMEEKNIKAAQITRDLKISSGNISGWKTGAGLPTNAVLRALADYLNTTPEYLIGETDVKERSPEEHTEEISPDELALIKSYRRNTEEIKKAARAVLGVGEDDYEPDYKLVAFGGDKRVNKTIKPKLT